MKPIRDTSQDCAGEEALPMPASPQSGHRSGRDRLWLNWTIRRIASAIYLLPAATLSAATVTAVSGGDAWAGFVKSDGSVWIMGYNSTLGNFLAPEITFPGGVMAISIGEDQGLAVKTNKTNGSLWVGGGNGYGQLGDGTTTNYDGGKQIVPGNVSAAAAGTYFSLFTKTDGTLWGMGYNGNGALGDGTTTDRLVPEQLPGRNVIAIAASLHSLFLETNGSLWGMGYNANGQLGDGTENNTNRPEEIVTNGVQQIAAGGTHSLFVKSDGSLWGMGDDSYGELGDGSGANVDRPEEILSNGVAGIAAGFDFSLLLKTDGSLWAMGRNDLGQLGDGTITDRHVPEEIVSNGVVAIAAGGQDSYFIKSDGSLWGMGWNYFGELGDGTTTERLSPVEIIAGLPQLAIAASDGAVTLSWPADGSGFVLQTNADLATTNWNDFGGTVVTNGQRESSTITPTAGNLFFRLKQ